MFCGWQLMFDDKNLAELGSGVLTLDILNEECSFNQSAIDPLKMMSGIRNWMLQDLSDIKIEIDKLICTEIEVNIEIVRQLSETVKGAAWVDPTPYYIKCKILCNSLVSKNDKKYISTYKDVEEWPESYSW